MVAPLGLVLMVLACLPAQAQVAVRNQGYIPYSDAPIFYRSDAISDPVSSLQRRIEAGTAQLEHDGGQHGYLKSVLKLLDIPASSQTLVFSKTSFQYPKISPQHPRALYFNDDVYIGVVNEGKEIEVTSFDKQQGAIFFILHEQKAEKPRFERAELDCTQCHIAAGTRGIPGVLLRSVQPTETGTLVVGARSFITDQDSPLKDRWGGWYVTGNLAGETLANSAAPADATVKPVTLAPLAKTFDPAGYLVPTSDQVALLVLAHQTQMHNLITLTNYRTRIALHDLGGETAASREIPDDTRQQFERPAEQLLRYLLFANEAALPGADDRQIITSSAFAREFAARGPRDSKGRSLRDFDLHRRIFRYPCSYLIYSDAFDALPEPASSYVWNRLLEVLSGKDESGEFDALSAEDRRAILEIVLETKHGLPKPWLDYARANHLRTAGNS
jgi:type IV secretory pathway protease TraF